MVRRLIPRNERAGQRRCACGHCGGEWFTPKRRNQQYKDPIHYRNHDNDNRPERAGGWEGCIFLTGVTLR